VARLSRASRWYRPDGAIQLKLPYAEAASSCQVIVSTDYYRMSVKSGDYALSGNGTCRV
jgi:hypothetical protein